VNDADTLLWVLWLCIGLNSLSVALCLTTISNTKTVVRALLIIIFKLHKRKVFFSPFDMAIVQKAIEWEQGSIFPWTKKK
jgi:hypothetical protein